MEYGPVAPHRSWQELEGARAGWPTAPRAQGTLELIVQRTATNERARPGVAQLDIERGLVGDRWHGSGRTADAQITLMDTRAAAAIAERAHWHLFGDNLLVDLDLGEACLPVGQRVRIGGALVEITPEPHLGCKKFRSRFGADALRWVNVKDLRALRLRGVHARVLEAGEVRVGDPVRCEP